MSVKISELPILDSLADNDVIAGVDTSANVTSKIEMATLKNYIDTNTQYTAGKNIDITDNVISAPFVYDKTQTNALIENLIDETNAQIEELQSEIDSLSMIYNAFPTESDEDESMTLDGTAEVKFKKFDLKGNASQTGTPTPSSPIPVNVVSGDNSIIIEGENLYNYKNTSAVGGQITVDNEGWITCTVDNTSGTSIAFRNYYTHNLNLKEDTDYSIIIEVKNVTGSGTVYSCSATSSQISSSQYYNFSNLSNNQVYIATKRTAENFSTLNDVGLRSYIQFTAGQSGSITFRLSVLEDTTVTSSNFVYKPYEQTIYPIDLPVENILNLTGKTLNSVSVSINTQESNKLILAGTGAWGSAAYIIKNPSKNGDFVISSKVKSALGRTTGFSAYGNSTESVSGMTNISSSFISINSNEEKLISYTFNTGNYEYIIVRFWNNGTATALGSSVDLIFDEIQLEKGSKQNSFTPYGTTPIELCKIGNYQDYFYKDSGKWYLHKEIGKVVLNGTQNVSKGGVETTNTQMFLVSVPGIITADGSGIGGQIISDRFTANINLWSYDEEGIRGNSIYTTNTCWIRINKSRLSENTSNAFKTWLASNNVKVCYPLAEVTNTEITYQPLIDQLNLLEKAMSKDGQTNISQVNNDLGFVIYAEAIKSLENVLDRLALVEE